MKYMASVNKKKYFMLKSIAIFLAFSSFAFSQTDCEDLKNNQLISFLKREYYENPVEGAKFISQFDQCKFLIGVGLAPTSSNSLSIMSRIAKTKAQRQVSEYLGGSTVTSDNILNTRQVVTENDIEFFTEYFDYIQTQSSSFVNGMETLTAFKSADGLNYVYIIVQTLKID